MYTEQGKKNINLNVLDVLKKYSDENHRLSQKDILDILESEYEMKVDRKAVKRNLMALIEAGYEIEYTEVPRMMINSKSGEKEDNSILTDFYYIHDFSDSELRLLIDSLLFCKHVPERQSVELIKKLENLSNKYFNARVKHIRPIPDNSIKNTQLFYTIEILDEAISKGCQVSFYYNNYGTDKKLYPRLNQYGEPRKYIINPYQIAANNGRYYLICNYDKYDNVANYRIDYITNIQLLDTRVKPMKNVKGLENGLNLPKHMTEHIYMFTGESEVVKFRFKKYIMNEVIDWFGKDIMFYDETDDEVTAKVTVSLPAMRRWALQYALHAHVLEPQRLVDEIKDDIANASKNYRQ